jgi:5'(3')-deoxyribonucleotidase
MRFLIDVDGVVADLVPHILQRLTAYEINKLHRQGFFAKFIFPQNTRAPSVPIAVPNIQDIKNNLFSKKESDLHEEHRKIAVEWIGEPGFARTIPVRDGALAGVFKIRQAGHEIFWVTSSWTSSKTWEYDRRKWLLSHFKDGHDKVVFAHSKFLCEGDVLIDDRIKNVRQWQGSHPSKKALLYTQPWNDNPKYKDFNRFNWDDIDEILSSL